MKLLGFPFIVTLSFVLLSSASAFAQSTLYVRSGATGNGSDWNNAYGSLPANLVRGTTYYVADGTYSGYIFDDPESGTQVITIKKATVADHGTSIGWSDVYGDGTATFSGDFVFKNKYYLIDGATRNENAWDDAAAYGFAILKVLGNTINYGGTPSYITVRYAVLGSASGYNAGMGEAVYIAFSASLTDWTIDRCLLRNGKPTLVQLAGCSNFLIQYCHLGPGWGKEAIRGQNVTTGVIIRYNRFIDSTQKDPGDATSGITAEIGIWDGNHSGVQIYGNTFTNAKFGGRNAVVVVGGNGSSWAGAGANGTKVYNNTFAGIAEGAVFSAIMLNGSSTEAKNNLFYNCADTDVSAISTAANLVASVNPFVNYGSLDLRLTVGSQARNIGTNLGGSYDRDALGTVRGADGVWDVGAYEFSGGTPEPLPTAPSNLRSP